MNALYACSNVHRLPLPLLDIVTDYAAATYKFIYDREDEGISINEVLSQVTFRPSAPKTILIKPDAWNAAVLHADITVHELSDTAYIGVTEPGVDVRSFDACLTRRGYAICGGSRKLRCVHDLLHVFYSANGLMPCRSYL